jgi:hypothetical protein
MSKKAILVLGMHRSGTSLLTRILSLLGAQPPRNLLPHTSENPGGYWESESVMKLNNELLSASGNNWKTYFPIREFWFDELLSGRLHNLATDILHQEFGEAELIVLKCPRICRLVPFWEAVLRDAGYDIATVMILRDPEDVFRSLAARSARPEFRPAAITQPEHSALLWLRYVLDAEYYSRKLKRATIGYTEIVSDWNKIAERLLESTGWDIPYISGDIKNQIDGLFAPEMRRQRSQDESVFNTHSSVFDPYRRIETALQTPRKWSNELSDTLRHDFDRICEHTMPANDGENVISEQIHLTMSQWMSRLLYDYT